MKTVAAKKARARLDNLLDELVNSHEPVQITGKRANGILRSEGDRCAIQETLLLISILRMRESIREGLDTPLEECSDELEW
ncbi:MAG: type II toxin-antitoxin system Phd/YefM family antitoxin [bacterium]